MLSFAARRFTAALPALALFALLAAVTAEATGRGWAAALGAIAAALPLTVALTVPAVAMGSGIGALLGLSAGLRPRSPAGWAGVLLGGIGPALPAFLLAAVFAALMTDRSFTLVLAWTALAAAPAAQAARVARAALDGALDGTMSGTTNGGGAILAARGRGLGDRAVLWHHAVPLGLAPVAGGLRGAVTAVVAGAVAVESLFALPGAGRLFLETMRDGDAGTAVAALAGLCGLAVLLNAAGAVLHGWFDPRFRTA